MYIYISYTNTKKKVFQTHNTTIENKKTAEKKKKKKIKHPDDKCN